MDKTISTREIAESAVKVLPHLAELPFDEVWDLVDDLARTGELSQFMTLVDELEATAVGNAVRAGSRDALVNT